MECAERQRQYRKDVAAERARMKHALEQIVAKLDGTEKPAALIILAIAKEGLNGKT